MTFRQIHSKIGRIPLHLATNADAKVFVEGKPYLITGIRYNGGIPLGFETMPLFAEENTIIKEEEP